MSPTRTTSAPRHAGLLLALWVALAATAPAQEARSGDTPVSPKTDRAFRFAPVNATSLGLWEGDQPVLVYNHGTMLARGAPADRARSGYVHPIHGLDGEVITDDFPRDHDHHRGLFWAWPHNQVNGREVDLWALKGVRSDFERWLDRSVDATGATLGVQNGWMVGSKKILDEEAWIRVHHATNDGRALDVALRLTPTDAPITLAGAEGKSYGGLTLRFAPGDDTVITVPTGRAPDDLYINRQPWTDLVRRWPGRPEPSGAALFVARDHPDYPPTWLTRHYGVLCLGWPGVTPHTLAAGKTIELHYRVWVHRGNPPADAIDRAYKDYAATPPWSPPKPRSGQGQP